jgi:hypothetical protein
MGFRLSVVLPLLLACGLAATASAQPKTDSLVGKATPAQAKTVRQIMKSGLFAWTVVLNCTALNGKSHPHWRKVWADVRQKSGEAIAYTLGPQHGIAFLKRSAYDTLMRKDSKFSTIIGFCRKHFAKVAEHLYENAAVMDNKILRVLDNEN